MIYTRGYNNQHMAYVNETLMNPHTFHFHPQKGTCQLPWWYIVQGRWEVWYQSYKVWKWHVEILETYPESPQNVTNYFLEYWKTSLLKKMMLLHMIYFLIITSICDFMVPMTEVEHWFLFQVRICSWTLWNVIIVVGVSSKWYKAITEQTLITTWIIGTLEMICSNKFGTTAVISYLISNSSRKKVTVVAAMKVMREKGDNSIFNVIL